MITGEQGSDGVALPWARVERPLGPDELQVEMDGAFAIAEGVCNGGYVLAVLHQVASAALADRGSRTTSALAVSSQFLAPTAPGSASVRLTDFRTGRNLSRVEVEIESAGRVAVRAVFVFSVPPDPDRPRWCSVEPPVMPPPGECRPMPATRGATFAWPTIYQDRIELLVDPATSGFLDGQPSGRGEIRTWWASRQVRVSDAGLLLLAMDAMPPGTMELEGVAVGSPTVQLEARLYCDEAGMASAGSPFRVRQQVLTAGSGTADQICEVWDRSGRLLASATQVNWLL